MWYLVKDLKAVRKYVEWICGRGRRERESSDQGTCLEESKKIKEEINILRERSRYNGVRT